MKLVTTLAALYTLGPAHRWTTSMLADARPEKGELKGNLYLRGGGDPDALTGLKGGRQADLPAVRINPRVTCRPGSHRVSRAGSGQLDPGPLAFDQGG